MKKFSRSLKMVGVITLFFFTWSYLPLFQFVAYAASQDKQTIKARPQRTVKQQPAEKLEKLLDDLKADTSKAEEKAAKGADATSEVEAIKARKAEIDTINSDLKKEFADTEQKLKSAHLPKEILDRHYKFFKNYEANLAELKANLDAIEKVKTPSALTAELSKTKKQLDNVKPAKMRKPFDPNNLPNRIVKAKERQPRMKKEEWEKEFPKKESKKEPKKSKAAQRQQQKPILVASNGSLAGLLSRAEPFSVSNPTEEYPQLAELSTDGLIMTAQTGSYGKHPFPPEIYPLPWNTDMTPEDKQETSETHVTDAIRAKAAELQNNPILMFNWLRNNIVLVPSYGSIQGADMCLQTKQCNFTDIASLTVAMFRAADWPARYEFLTAELDIARFMENMGGFTDPVAAINFAASGGIPVRGITSGGKITAVQFEHVYATALLPMGYYIGVGSLMRRGWSEPMWMPLDVSLKHYVTTPGIDINAAVPFDAQTFANQVQATATINEADGFVTNVNSALIQQTMQDYQTRVQNFISQTTPTATIGDVIGKREIKQYNLPHLYPTGWFKPVTARIQSHTLPDSMLHKVSFVLQDSDTTETSLSYTVNLAEVAGKRVTVCYDPTTAADQATINNYVDQGATSIPAYLIQFKPVLKIEGAAVATGMPVGMGFAQALTISLISPNGNQIIDHDLLAGDYTAIGINPSTINLDVLNNRINKNDFSEPVGEMLHQTALSYWAEADAFNDIIAKTLRVNNLRHPSELAASAKVSVSYIWGVPSSATYNRRNIDVKLDNQSLASKTADKTKEFSYMQQSGVTSSFLEGAIMDQLFGRAIGNSISAVTALKAANDQSIPIYRIDSSNVSAALPKLQIADTIKNEISNAVNAGLKVQIPQTNISQSGWTGVGYVISNPTDGTGAYRISGGLNGSDSVTASLTVTPSSTPPSSFIGLFMLTNLATDTGLTISVGSGVLAGTELTAAALLLTPAFWILVLLLILLALLLARAINCDAQYEQDSGTCRQITNSAARARCWASAADRYGACLAGRPLPPLVTW